MISHLAALTHEPLSALTSGADGLEDIRRIIAQAPAYLAPGGWLLLEHGWVITTTHPKAKEAFELVDFS